MGRLLGVIAAVALLVGAYLLGQRKAVAKYGREAVLTPTPPIRECNPGSGFDTDSAHYSAQYEVTAGVFVSIVPAAKANELSLPMLAQGQVLAKFVNHSDQPFDPLALAPRGESCLVVQASSENGGRLIARVVPAGGQGAARAKSLYIDFHDTTHTVPMASWVNVDTARVRRSTTVAGLADLIRFAAFQGDSTSGSGPGAWVTCATNGCCRVSIAE
jgi:hypothetical protein